MVHDLIFAAGSWAFSLALLPALFGPNKPPLATSVLTAVVLWIFAINYMTLGLEFTAVSTAVSAWLWTHLALQAHETRNDEAVQN